MSQLINIFKTIFNAPFEIIILRIFGYNKPYRVAILRLLVLILKKFRPHYYALLYESFYEAKKLNYSEISVIEFGVAGGNGLLAIEKYCEKLSKKFKIDYQIFGFDFGGTAGGGLMETKEPKDITYFWSKGDFKMNEEKLKKKIKKSNLIIGDINKTLDNFVELYKPPKISTIFFDLDYYTSTKNSFKIFDNDDKYFMPRVFCYFDDVHAPANNFTGVHAAINEFNLEKKKKIVKDYGSSLSFKYGPFYEEVYLMHNFEHKDYLKKVYSTIIETKL
jgi:hypothetical protein